MAALASALPAPSYTSAVEEYHESPVLPSAPVSTVPKYGSRKGWKPKTALDYGNGGAYPECHVAQYPLDMGRKKVNKGTTLALQVDQDGTVRYDAIAQHGRAVGSKVQSSFKDLVPLHNRADVTEKDRLMERPDESLIQETTDRTRLALERITNGKIKAAQPKHVPKSNQDSSYIRYTPANQGADEGKQRIIKMTTVQEDPLEPPRFKHKKIPRAPDEPPPPVLQSPPRAATAQDQKDWMIPPCISNWKNNKGYTIPLDKRLAADGRGLQDVSSEDQLNDSGTEFTEERSEFDADEMEGFYEEDNEDYADCQIHINDNFAKFAESLHIADRHAREEVRARQQMTQLLAQKEKAQKEEGLRLLAQRAREERSGATPSIAAGSSAVRPQEIGTGLGGYASDSDSDASDSEAEASEEDEEAIRAREQVRAEKRREREKQMRLNNMGSEMRAKMIAKEANRDISEKIALGLAKPSASKETLLDSRLFNRESLGTGFASEDSYNLYDKPLFHGSSAAAAIYKPRGNDAGNDETFGGGTEAGITEELKKDRFNLGNATRGFEGADTAEMRDGPVQFEKDQVISLDGTADPFGVEQFMDAARRGGKRTAEDREEERRKRQREE